MEIKKFLYIIRCNSSNFYKIGVSQHPEYRITDLQVGCPYSLVLVYKKQFDNAKEVESLLHRKYWKRCVEGEWFELSKDDIDSIQQGLNEYPTNYYPGMSDKYCYFPCR